MRRQHNGAHPLRTCIEEAKEKDRFGAGGPQASAADEGQLSGLQARRGYRRFKSGLHVLLIQELHHVGKGEGVKPSRKRGDGRHTAPGEEASRAFPSPVRRRWAQKRRFFSDGTAFGGGWAPSGPLGALGGRSKRAKTGTAREQRANARIRTLAARKTALKTRLRTCAAS